MSILVLFLFFAIIAIMIYGDTESRFLSLVIGTILFPTTALIIKNPSISPQHILLYAYFFIEFLKDRDNFNKSIFKNILTIPIFINLVSYVFTAAYNSGIASKDMYYGVRDSIDCLGYIYAAFIFGKKADLIHFAKKLQPFIFILCFFGIAEILLNDNLPYRIINSAFPYYEGSRDLNTSMSLTESWRFRTCFTTKHPTAFGTLLMTLFLFYVPYFKNKKLDSKKISALLILLCINLFLCGSRTAMICSAFGVCLIAYFRLSIFFKILLTGILIFSFSLIVSIIVENFQTNTDHGGSSLDFRTKQLVFCMASIYNSPILGNGNKYTSHVIFAEETRAHNSYGEDMGGLESVIFTLLIDRGFLGLFSYYLLLIWMLAILFKYQKKVPEIAGGFALVASGIAFLTLSGTIGNSSSFIFLFTGLQLGNIVKFKELPNEQQEANLKELRTEN